MTFIVPMLAQDWCSETISDWKYPCVTQPKLDGIRCIAMPTVGLFSRLGNKFEGLVHVETELALFDHSLIYDGELYIPGATLSQVVEALRGDASERLRVKLFVYDVVTQSSYLDRRGLIDKQLVALCPLYIEGVSITWCVDEKDVDNAFSKYLQEGFEGAICRDITSPYIHGRCGALLKRKVLSDAEYIIIGVGKLRGGKIQWYCKTYYGNRFECWAPSVRGLDPYACIGKKLTIRFDKVGVRGIPISPIGVVVRDYE